MPSKFHVNAGDPPVDDTGRASLIKWVMSHPLWVHKSKTSMFPWVDDVGNPLAEENMVEFDDGGFQECVEITPVYVNPETESIDDDESKNTGFRVWVEAGGWVDISIGGYGWPEPPDGWNHHNKWMGCHDIYLDCSGRDLEEAMVNLALRVKLYYGDTTEHLPNFVKQCEGVFLSENYSADSWRSTCTGEGNGYCSKCGHAVEETPKCLG